MRTLICFLILLPWVCYTQGSFPPAAGAQGTTAIHKDSSVFVNWATNCITSRGLQDIAVLGSPLVTLGDDYNATDKSGINGTVSLGDGGEAILTFDLPITNEPGWDFVVFENSFDGLFLELAFVEVSSDGVNFFRFPATSEVQDTLQTNGFGNTNPTKIDNLAGKYKAQYGTPFDLEELDGEIGLDINNITHVKVIDVVGSIAETFASFDQFGNKINDPYPTNFTQGGFDLDAVGVIHQNLSAGIISDDTNLFQVFPTVTSHQIQINSSTSLGEVQLISLEGKVIYDVNVPDQQHVINVENLNQGIYLIKTDHGIKRFAKI